MYFGVSPRTYSVLSNNSRPAFGDQEKPSSLETPFSGESPVPSGGMTDSEFDALMARHRMRHEDAPQAPKDGYNGPFDSDFLALRLGVLSVSDRAGRK